MNDSKKTKEELISELETLRNEVAKNKQFEDIKLVLLEITKTINTTENLGEFFESIRIILNKIINTENFFIALYDKKSDNLDLLYLVDEKVSFKSMPAKETLFSLVIKKNKSLLITEEDFRKLDKDGIVKNVGVVAKVWAGAPLRSKDYIIGVIAVQSYKDVSAYTEKDLRILEYVSDLVSIAIEHNQTKEKLKEKEEKYRLITETSQFGIWQIDSSGKFIFANEAFANFIGYKNEEIIDKHFMMLVPPNDVRMSAIFFKRAMLGYSDQIEYLFKHKDGHLFPGFFSVVPIKKDGKIVGLTGVMSDLTEQKKVTDTIKESEEKFRAISTTATDAIIILNEKAETTFWNDAATKIFGFTREEILGKDLNKFIVPKRYYEDYKKGFAKFLITGKGPLVGYTRELTAHTKDGTEFPMEISMSAFKNKNKWNAVGIIRDITERKQEQLESERNANELRQLIETANAPIFGIDLKGKVNEWNVTTAKITGFSKEEVLGKDLVEEFITDDYKQSVSKVLNDALEGKDTSNYEFPLYTKDKKPLMILLNASVRRDVEGNITGVLGIGQDITELYKFRSNLEIIVKERTKELNISLSDAENARDNIDAILKSIADGLIVTDIHNQIVLMNSVAEDFLNIRLSEVINRSIYYAIKDKSLRNLIKNTFDKIDTESQFDFILAGKDLNQSKILRARASIIKDKKGNNNGIIIIIQDISKEREIDKMKTEFISTAAHELRTPLTSIQGFSEILLTRDDISDQEKKKFLGHINNQATNLTRIINDLLDISRIESGKGYVLEREPCMIGDAIKIVVDPFITQTKIHKFEVVVPKKPVEIIVDKEKMEQVLENLINNAVKYSPDGGKIQIKGELIKDNYQVSVQDEGVGMTREQVEKIFDKFYRADTTNTAIEGTGLGMSIVKNIVEAHDGKVWVESEIGKGTKVTFTLPLD
ncbi:MAG: PAS domain S-box protein [Bacteroidetes bacterium]|nr:PAS domain S-box protein [Bacteroidota bacterium]